jgi:sugar lactone lactonase YvrE
MVRSTKLDLAAGRIWFATCAEGESDVKPTLYLFDPSTTQVVVVPCAPAELTMPNAMVISQGRFYMACSERGKIWSWRLDLDATDPPAMLNDGRLFLEIDKPAVPDGMTADADGNLWLACFNAGSVRVFSPQGMLLRTIHLPAELPTCTVFAGESPPCMLLTHSALSGPALDDLIVTTHAVQDELRQQVVDAGQDSLRSVDDVKRRWPEDKGGIYRVKVPGVRGLAKPRVG